MQAYRATIARALWSNSSGEGHLTFNAPNINRIPSASRAGGASGVLHNQQRTRTNSGSFWVSASKAWYSST